MTASTLTRRKLLFASSALGLTLLFRRRQSRAAATTTPRFLLNIVASGGLDNTMMFDARPMAMTAAGKIHNPLAADPMQWVGTNGQTALSASTASNLYAVRDRFSVVNGVVMSTTFDGHDQNTNLFLAGNPFGGTSFNTDLNADSSAPLDYVRLGEVFGATLQDGRTIPLTEPALKQLVAGVSSLDGLSPSLDDFLASESGKLGNDTERFGAGVVALDAANGSSKELQRRIKSIQLGNEQVLLDQQLAVIREVFRLDIARGAMLAIDGNDLFFDNHAAAAAKAQGPSFTELSRRLARVFDYLATTPFDGSHSLIDVTTVVVGTEFGRTMRQVGMPIDNTGTDHNPLSNSILVGGAGIKGGQVIGASDFQTADEVLSGAHQALDPMGVKVMGRPFDFQAGTPRSDLPATFVASDYLQIASVINTVYSLFGVDQSKWRVVERGGAVAPVLTSLLA
jgi:uncharacterized protein (DUF1501 family)